MRFSLRKTYLSIRLPYAYLGVVLFLLHVNVRGGNLTSHVDPFVGTGGHGHTFPGATTPFGMVQISPDTRVDGWDACAGYHYSDSMILGFSHTHLSGTGVADYGDILFSPTSGELNLEDRRNDVGRYASRFHHQSERASPGYYSVRLDDYNIFAELTSTGRVGVHRYTFPKLPIANIVVNLHHGLGPDRVLESEIHIIGDREITGMRRSEGWAKDQHIFFVAQFSKPFESFGVILDGQAHPDERSTFGQDVKGYVRFVSDHEDPLVVKVGISAASIDGARKNLEAEMPGWDFDRMRTDAEDSWERELHKVTVEGGTEEQLRTFYTALYHAMVAPNLFSDVDGGYRGMDGKIHYADGFNMYTVFSLWDTFRAEHPLMTIIDQKRTRDFVRSLIAKYEESSNLPVWELSANETWCMIGYHSVPVIVDAYMKGIRDFDSEKAFTAMKQSAMADRFGLGPYREHGYVPGEMEPESVSKTLEYAYDDWCIAQMAQELGKTVDEEKFLRRAQFYKNIFDRSTGFMRAKDNGSWVEPFDPKSVTVHYTEANAWQYSFFAPQDVNGLIDAMGGRDKFVAKLDSLFYAPSDLTGRKQDDISGLIGQYAQGNEPSHHVGYLYNYAGAPWKTQAIVRQVLDSLFAARPDGLCGNDDCGQMSAWYVMSALGIYQVTPALPIYALSTPIFEKATIHLENGKEFILRADGSSSSNKYIQSVLLNGQVWTKSYITHGDIMNGGILQLTVASQPSTTWATSADDLPHTTALKPIVTAPRVLSHGKSFLNSTEVALVSDIPGADIRYTLDGSEPTISSARYSQPIKLYSTTTMKAIAVKGDERSESILGKFVKRQPTGSVTLNTRYSDQYTGGGNDALVDGVRGMPDFRLGAWQGYEQTDLDAVLDLQSKRTIDSVALSCLQDIASWIFFPVEVEFSFSDDGKKFHDDVRITNVVSQKDESVQIKLFSSSMKSTEAQYVRVRARNVGICPEWHRGAGGKAWLFSDEVLIHTK